MNLFLVILYSIFIHLVHNQDICSDINCGSGVCLITQNPALPYFCRCPSGSNTILPCPSENPCSRNPCGSGICEVVPSLLHGYLCRCAGDIVSLTSCNVTYSGCHSNPCINGLCIEGLSAFFCNCLPTWTGRFCDEKILSPCSKNPCGHGKCFTLNDPNIPYVCLCPNGQFSISCRNMEYPLSTARVLTVATTTTTTTTTTITTTTTTTTRSSYACNPFDSHQCKNGGRCLQTVNSYRCLCSLGYTGSFCELNINECASNPCQYGGICYDLQASYMCYCPDGHFRTQCSPKSVITSTARTLSCPCQNGGICSRVNSQICTCPNGFTGNYCEHSLPTGGCRQIQCSHGGTCLESRLGSPTSAYCACPNGYTGKFCEIEYFRCRANGRFVDLYNCEQGKYFECIHYQQGADVNPYGMLLSRNCPISLRFNSEADRCDYAQNVKCSYV